MKTITITETEALPVLVGAQTYADWKVGDLVYVRDTPRDPGVVRKVEADGRVSLMTVEWTNVSATTDQLVRLVPGAALEDQRQALERAHAEGYEEGARTQRNVRVPDITVHDPSLADCDVISINGRTFCAEPAKLFGENHVPTFEEAWKHKEAEGYQYGHDAIEQVRFGWEIRAKYAGPAPDDAWKDQDDKPLAEDHAIEAAFPTRSGDHEKYAEAMRLVGARYSKGGLVALVNWLLHRAACTGAATRRHREPAGPLQGPLGAVLSGRRRALRSGRNARWRDAGPLDAESVHRGSQAQQGDRLALEQRVGGERAGLR